LHALLVALVQDGTRTDREEVGLQPVRWWVIKLFYSCCVSMRLWITQRTWDNLTELESRLEALCDLQPSGEQALRDWKKRKKKAVVVAEKAEAADVLAEQVCRVESTVQAESEKLTIERSMWDKIAAVVNIQKASCESGVAAVDPLVKEAEATLECLDKKDCQELKAFTNPSAGVNQDCEAVSAAIGCRSGTILDAIPFNATIGCNVSTHDVIPSIAAIGCRRSSMQCGYRWQKWCKLRRSTILCGDWEQS